MTLPASTPSPRPAIVEIEISKRWANENPAPAYSRVMDALVNYDGYRFRLDCRSEGFVTLVAERD